MDNNSLLNNSLLSNNKEVTRLRPSKPAAPTTLTSLFTNTVTSYIAPPSINRPAVTAAFDRGSPWQKAYLQLVTPYALLTYFRPYFHADTTVSAGFKACFDKFLAQLQQLDQLKLYALPFMDQQKKKTQLRTEHIKEILALPVGQKKLMLLNSNSTDLLYLLVARTEQGISIKVMGRGELMSDFAHRLLPDSSPHEGVRLRSCISFENMPIQTQEWWESFFIHSEYGVDISSKGIAEHLYPLRNHIAKTDRTEKLQKKTDNLFKSMWSSFQHFGFFEEDNKHKVPAKLLQLRLEIASLFASYDTCKGKLTAGSEDHRVLESLLRAVSEDVYLSYTKNRITREDLLEIVNELKVIKTALENAPPEKASLSTSPSGWGMNAYINAQVSDLQVVAPSKVTTSEVLTTETQAEPIPPSRPLPEVSFEIQRVPAEQLEQHLTDILTTTSTVKFLNGVRALASNYDTIDKEKSVVIMKQLLLVTERLIKIYNENPSRERYYEIFKPIAITARLTTRHFPWNNTFFTILGNCSNNPMFYFHIITFLTDKSGYRMEAYCHDDPTSYCERLTARNENIPQEEADRNFEYYKKQLEMIGTLGPQIYLFPLRTYDINFTRRWMRPITHPLLVSIFTRIQMDVIDTQYDGIYLPENMKKISGKSVSSFSNRGKTTFTIQGMTPGEVAAIEVEAKKMLREQQGLMTPEAMVDNPELVSESVWEELRADMKRATSNFLPLFLEKPTYTTYKDIGINEASPRFTKEEIEALLLLSRKTFPQTEIIAFIEKYPALFKDPEVRAFLDMLFFRNSLKETLKERPAFRELLPKYLADKIDDYHEKAKTNPEYLELMSFCIDWNDRINHILSTGSSTKSLEYVREYIQKARENDAYLPHLHSLFTRELQLLLTAPKVSATDVHSVLVANFLRKTMTGDPRSYDPMIENVIEDKTAEILEGLKEKNVTAADLSAVLEEIRIWKKLEKGADWQGTFPVFHNGRHSIDLEKGIVKAITNNSIIGSVLPEKVVLDPFFSKAYPGLDVRGANFTFTQEGVKKIWTFTDQNRRSCQIEETAGVFHYYKTIGGTMLQVIDFSRLQPKPKADMISLMNQAMAGQGLLPFVPTLPGIFDQGLYMNPAKPWEGLCINSEGKLLYKVQFGGSMWLTINSITDCRDNSGPWEAMSGSEVSHPVVNLLSCFEHQSYMLLWGNNGIIKKVELPRFGLTFIVQGENLICQTPAYKGYKVELNATNAQKKQIAFSLLLSPPEAGMASKLLVPDAEAFALNVHMALKWNSGIAWLMWFTGARNHSAEDIKLAFENRAGGANIPFYSLDIRPCTEELVASKNQQLTLRLELARQMLMQSKFELAFRTLEAFDLKKDLFTARNKNLISGFLSKSYGGSGFEAAVKLKYIARIGELLHDDAQHDNFKKILKGYTEALLPTYQLHKKKLSPAILLTDNEIEFLQRNTINAARPVPLEVKSVNALEQAVKPGQKVEQPHESRVGYVKAGTPLLFSAADLEFVFSKEREQQPQVDLPPVEANAQPCEKQAVAKLAHQLDHFRNQERYEYTLSKDISKLNTLEKRIKDKITDYTKQRAEARKEIDKLLSNSNDPQEQISMYGKVKVMANYEELMLAMLQNNLESLKERDRLPIDIDCGALRRHLINYFDAEVRINLAEACLKQLHDTILGDFDMDARETADKTRTTESTILHSMLAGQRHYDADKNVDLLIFEALKWLTYRSGDVNQLELLNDMLETETGVTIAPTGVGKTMVLSILRALMQPNGDNLVTQMVLTPLLQQTRDVMENDIVGIFKGNVYPLRFDMKTRLDINEMVYEDDKVKAIPSSAFKTIYQKLLQTIVARGCVVTDYKSLPLLRAKFIKYGRDFLAKRNEGIPLSDADREHWSYLRKILILLRNRNEVMMDEFDQPNRPIHRIQLSLEKAKKPAEFLVNETIKCYQFLVNLYELLLEENLQSEVTPQVRKKCLENLSHMLAKELTTDESLAKELAQYMQGINDDVLSKVEEWDPSKKDLLAFYKDQVCIYLPLTLAHRASSRYKRSDDAKRILPCFAGEKHEAKFGSTIEEINYMIQDYIQVGIMTAELTDWIDRLLKDRENGRASAEETFAVIFPNVSLQKFKPEEVASLAFIASQDMRKILYFLQLRLNDIRVSGSVISIDPQDSVTMNKSVSAISATLGCSEVLHRQFTVDKEVAGRIRAGMAFRLLKRLIGPQQVLEFDPRNPTEVLDKAKPVAGVCAVIDGAGAFLQMEPGKVANAINKANPALKKVGFYTEEGQVETKGDVHAPVSVSGFYYSEPNTRGADIKLPENGVAVLTVGNQGSLESLNQNEGRMRRPGQKVILARSNLATNLETVGDVLGTKARFEGREQAQDLFKAKKAELRNAVMTEAWDNLLAVEDIDQFVNAFVQYQDLFITPAAPTYEKPGEYFRLNHALRKCTQKPENVLQAINTNLQDKCQRLGLSEALKDLKEIHYSPELVEMMPEFVYKAEDDVETGLELELEEEQEQELELENELEEELELESEKQRKVDVPYYLPREETKVVYQACYKIHRAYAQEIEFTESFLPLSRTDPLYKRKPHDDKSFRVGVVRCDMTYTLSGPQVNKITIGDVLDDINIAHGVLYDVRTDKVIYENAMFKLDPTSDQFRGLIAQIKFLDGETEKYTDQEFKLLTQWLKKNDAKKMRSYFEKDVLKYRDDVRATYPQSKLFKFFKQF